MTARDDLRAAHRGDPGDYVVSVDGTGRVDDMIAKLAQLRPTWHRDAACRGEPVEVFFPSPGQRPDLAFELCGRCEVREPCLAEAIADETLDHGVRGGMSARARKAHRLAQTARSRKRARS